MNDRATVAERFGAGPGGILNWLGGAKRKLQQFVESADSETYLWKRFTDGAERMDRVQEAKQVGRLGDSDVLARVTQGAFEAQLGYSQLTGNEGTAFDVTIVGTWRISDCRTFLNDYGLARLKVATDVSITEIETILAGCCKQAVTDEMRTVTYEALKQQDALPLKWWASKLSQWIGAEWLELVKVKDVRYESATADKAEEIKTRQEFIELEAAEREQQHDREMRRQHAQADYEKALRELQARTDLKEQELQAQLEQVKLEHDKFLLQAREEVETARLEAEKKRAVLEAEIARIRNRSDDAAERLQRAKESEKRTQEVLEQIHVSQAELTETAKVFQTAVQEGLAGAERISASATGVSSATMSLLGKAEGSAYLARVLREKAMASPEAVMMRKVELRTRDIGTKKVDSLAINTSLQFEFLSQRPGFATVLNIGTSGTVWLQSPNAYVGVDVAKVESGQKHQIPGQLLPTDDLSRNGLAYLEVGPPGWEELIAIVSKEPLMTEADVFRSTPNSPFVALSTDRIEQLLDQLAELGEDDWNTGVLSFLVE